MENQKKILVVYYSKSGNTERAAKDIAQSLGADLEKIIDLKSRSGIMGYIFGGRDAAKKIGTQIGPLKYDPAAYGLVVIGTPVWGWNMVPAVRTYLEENKSKIKNLAFFETSGGTAPEKIAAFVEEVIGVKVAVFAGFDQKELRDKKLYEEKIAVFVGQINKI